VNERGEAVVVWRGGNHGAVARAIDAKGRLLRAVDLGPTEGGDVYSVALSDKGRWLAAWQTQRMRKTGADPYLTVKAARGSLRASKAVTTQLDYYHYAGIPDAAIRVRMDSTGRPVVAWSSAEDLTGDVSGTRFLVRVASGTSDGRLGEPQTIRVEDRGAYLADLETGPDGRAVLLWSTAGVKIPYYERVQPELHALYRAAPGQPFGPDEHIDALNDGAAVAFDPVSGRPLAIWDTLRESFRG